MNIPPLYLRLALLLMPVLPAAGAPASPLERAWPKIENPSPSLGSRDIMGFALQAAGSPDYAQHGKWIETAFQELERMQDRNPSSKTYGNYCWYWREEKPGDPNAVEFVTQQMIILKMRYYGNLSPAAQASIDGLLKLAVEGIHRQKVDVGYTNMYLMKTWNLLALGQALQNPDLTKEGSDMQDNWIAFTSRNGIREYLSPTYYGTDLDSLGLMAGMLSNPPAQEKAQRILRLFWTDMAANWFEPAHRLGGAHGRDYDYLYGHGYLDQHLLDAGWVDPKVVKPADTRVFAAATRWVPPADLHRQAISGLPRFVFQKWDALPGDWASQYIGQHFSIGVSGASQGPEDKPFAINIAGPAGPKTVMVNFFMDGRNDPYGQNKVATGASGHPKAHHLFPFFTAVQSGPEVLFVSTYPNEGVAKKKAEISPACLYSQMDLPIEAAVWTADGPAAPDKPSEPLPGNLCFLRMGDVAVGIQFMLALDTDGKPATAQVVNDGAALGARHLSVTHTAGPLESGRGVVAVRVRAAEGLDDAGFAAFRQSFSQAKSSARMDGSVVHLKADGLSGPLALDADLSAGKILNATGADPAMLAAPMSVNGKEFCKSILQTSGPAGF